MDPTRAIIEAKERKKYSFICSTRISFDETHLCQYQYYGQRLGTTRQRISRQLGRIHSCRPRRLKPSKLGRLGKRLLTTCKRQMSHLNRSVSICDQIVSLWRCTGLFQAVRRQLKPWHFWKYRLYFGQCTGQRRRSTFRTPANWSTCKWFSIACLACEPSRQCCRETHSSWFLWRVHAFPSSF